MSVLAISEQVFEVGASHPDRKLFDCLMPTPHGTTYNSYLIFGSEKTALIDAVDPEKTEVLLNNLEEAGVKRLDYLINLHTEQDHAGSAEAVRCRYPEVEFITNAKVKELMHTHLHIPEDKMTVVTENDIIELGGKTLSFMMIPFAHWPDNYMVHLKEDNILFSSDLFGSHYATSKAFSTSSAEQRLAAKNYFAEIMLPYRSHVAKYVKRVRELGPRMIAPSHGPVWYDPDIILRRYDRWVGDSVKNLVAIPYVSMHESTKVMVERLTIKLSEQGLSVVCRNLGAEPDSLSLETGHFITDLVDAAAVIMATPTVIGGPHPNIAYAAIVANAMRPKTRFYGMIGSYGWGSKAADTLEALTSNLKAERLDPIMVKGLPREEDLARLDELAIVLAEKIKALPDLVKP